MRRRWIADWRAATAGVVFLLATLVAMPLDVLAINQQKVIFDAGISNYNTDLCGSSGSSNPDSCAALAEARREIAGTMSDTDKVNLYKRASVESSSSSEHKKAMLETMFNRTLSWNMGSIQCVIAANDSNNDCSGGKNGAGYWGSRWPSSLSGDQTDWDKIFDEVVGGSNFTNFADGNASYANAEWNQRFVNAIGCALPSGESECQPMPTSISEVKPNVEYYMRHTSQSSEWDNLIASCSSSQSSSSSSSSSVKYSYADGIFGGLEGLTDKTADFADVREHGNANLTPKSILLHSTQGPGGWAYGDRKYAVHFYLNPITKQTQQHVPANIQAGGVATSEGDASAIQIEITGFAIGTEQSGSEYNLSAFGDEEWDYLATYLIAIATEFDIDLSTSVNWENPIRLSRDEIKKYNGILGHMHMANPPDDHTDPGNIWPQVKTAIARGGHASSDGCDASDNRSNGNVLAAVEKFIVAAQQYGSIYSCNASAGDCSRSHGNQRVYIDEFLAGKHGYDTDCSGFVAAVLYIAFGEYSYHTSGSIANGNNQNLEEINESEVRPGDVGAHDLHGWIVTKVENGKITEVADTTHSSSPDKTGANKNVGRHDVSGSSYYSSSGGYKAKYFRWKGGGNE